jgi:DNA-directed RNA polymerase specialized sigma24 family protein
MALPEFSDKAAWSAFFENPQWNEVEDEELVRAFRRFFFAGNRKAEILMRQLSRRVAAYAKASSRSQEIQDETRSLCLLALCRPVSKLAARLERATEHYIRTYATYLRKQKKIHQAKAVPLSDYVVDTVADVAPSPEDIAYLVHLIETIPEPRQRAVMLLVIEGYNVTGRNGIAEKLGLEEHQVRKLIEDARKSASKKLAKK